MDAKTRAQYPAVELCLLLFSVCVFLLDSQTGPYLPGFRRLSSLLLRLATPYFFVAAGFFWGERLYAAPEAAGRVTKRACLRLAKKLLLFEPLVIAMRCCTALLDGWAWRPFLRQTLLELVFLPRGPYWFLQALLFDLLLLLPLVRRGKEERAVLPALLLYALGSLVLSYAAYLEGGALAALYAEYCKVCLSVMNGLFFGLFFTLAGLLIAKHRARLASGARRRWLLLAASYALLVLETLLVKPGLARDYDAMRLSFSLLIPALFVCTAFYIRVPLRRPALLRRLSVSLFLLHLPLVWGWTGVLRRLSLITEPRANAFTGAALSVVSFAVICAVVYRKRWQPVYDWIT